MSNKKSTNKPSTTNRSLLIANLSVLWILVFLFAYIWGGLIQKIENPNHLKNLMEIVVFWIINFFPFLLGSFGVSYAIFRKKFIGKGNRKSVQIIGCILLGAVLSSAVIISVNGIAYIVLN